MTETACAAVAFVELLYYLERDLLHGHEDHLRNAFAGLHLVTL